MNTIFEAHNNGTCAICLAPLDGHTHWDSERGELVEGSALGTTQRDLLSIVNDSISEAVFGPLTEETAKCLSVILGIAHPALGIDARVAHAKVILFVAATAIRNGIPLWESR